MRCRFVALTAVVVYPDHHRSQRDRAHGGRGTVQGPPTIGVASTSIIGAPPKG